MAQLIGSLRLRIAELEEELAARPVQAPKRTPRPGSQASRLYRLIEEHGGAQGMSSKEVQAHVPELSLNYVCALLASMDGIERLGERRHYRYRVKG